MNVLVFEWLTGGGLWHDNLLPDFQSSIQRQGFQMWEALCYDLVEMGAQVTTPIDVRMYDQLQELSPLLMDRIELRDINSPNELQISLGELPKATGFRCLIAPECEGRLLNCVRKSETSPSTAANSLPQSNRLISPDASFVKLTSSKTTTLRHLFQNGFDQLPRFVTATDLDRAIAEGAISFPLVIKPSDGAGSEGVQLTHNPAELALHRTKEHWHAEAFITGTPVSVAVIGGPINQILLPMKQVFDTEPFGAFVTSEPSLSAEAVDRAIDLTRKALDALPFTNGYFGIDMIISDNGASGDCLIEINPRLTMSYLTLRELYSENLAQLMIESASAETVETKKQADSRINSSCIFREPSL